MLEPEVGAAIYRGTVAIVAPIVFEADTVPDPTELIAVTLATISVP